MSNNQEHTNTDNMENQTQQALEKDSAQYANEVTGAENAAEKDSAGKKPGSTVPGSDEKRIRELAESIRVKSLSDVPFDRDPLHAAAKRIKVYLSPVNIANAIHHGKLSKDIEL